LNKFFAVAVPDESLEAHKVMGAKA
jgi:hypothetical protein